MVAAAVIGAGVLGAGATIYGAQKAAGAEENAAGQTNALQKYEYDQTRADQLPYRTSGYAALGKLGDLLGISGNKSASGYGSLLTPFTGASVATDPGYQFGLKQGQLARENSAAAAGGLYSGATLKALTQYGNDYATTKFDDAFNRDNVTKTGIYNKLSNTAGQGQIATNQVDQAGQQYATNAGNNLIGAGNTRGAADIGIGNVFGGGINQGGAWWLRQRQDQAPPNGWNFATSPYSGGADSTGGEF